AEAVPRASLTRWSSLRRKALPTSTQSSITRRARQSCAAMPRRRASRRASYRVSVESLAKALDIAIAPRLILRMILTETEASKFPDHALAGRRRQEVDVVLGGEFHDIIRILLLHIVNGPEQVIEALGGRNPEQCLRALL